MFKKISLILAVGLGMTTFAGGTDTSGNPINVSTLFGNVDGATTAMNDIYTVMNTQVIQGVDGPYTPWTNNWEETMAFPIDPYWDGTKWNVYFTNSLGQKVDGTYSSTTSHNITEWAVPLTIASSEYQCTFYRSGITQYTNLYGFATLSNLAAYAKQTDLDNYVTKTSLASYDTSYNIVTNITTENQTITYLAYDAASTPPVIDLVIPSEGRCKDWLVYIFPGTNTTISLDAGIYWASDASVTNEISAGVLTALYFSQVCEDPTPVFCIGRKEFGAMIEITTTQTARFLEFMRRTAAGKRKWLR